MDTQITIEAEIANLKINDGETVPELINRYQFLITRLPRGPLGILKRVLGPMKTFLSFMNLK